MHDVKSIFSEWRRLSWFAVLSSVTLVLGFGRQLVVAAVFGASRELDVFVAVMGFFLFLGVQIGNAVENAVVGRCATLERSHLRHEAVAIFRTTALAGVGLAALSIVVTPIYLKVFFPTFDQIQLRDGETLAIYFALAVIPAILCGAVRGVLYVVGRFELGFIAGGVLSVVVIGFVLGLGRRIGSDAIAMGYACGNLVVLGGLLWSLKGSFRSDGDAAHGMQVASESIAGRGLGFVATTGVVVAAEALYLGVQTTERSFASLLGAGTVSQFYYAASLIQVIAALVFMPVSTSLFPKMARQIARDGYPRVQWLRGYVGALLCLGVSGSVVFWWGAEDIVRLVFLHGNFLESDVPRTAEILRVTGLSLPFLSVGRIFRYAHYSVHRYSPPVIVNLIWCATLAALCVVLIPRFSVVGLASASAAGTALAVVSSGALLAVYVMGCKRDLRQT